VITLDADLQNPPEEIARLLVELDAGHDYVGTIRIERQDVAWRRYASRLVNKIRERTTQVKITDQGSMFRGYARVVVDAVNQCSEYNTFVPALAYTFSMNPTEVRVAHEERGVRRERDRDAGGPGEAGRGIHLERLRRGAGGRTVAILDPEAAGVEA